MAVILTADDDVGIRKLIAFTLTRGGHRVLEAGDGGQALRRIEEEPPDLVVTDGEMPHMTGYELGERLRSIPRLAGIPILIVSGSLRREQIAEGLPFFDDYLAKPFNPATLREAVARLLEP